MVSIQTSKLQLQRGKTPTLLLGLQSRPASFGSCRVTELSSSDRSRNLLHWVPAQRENGRIGVM
jgi:hypothetical protein